MLSASSPTTVSHRDHQLICLDGISRCLGIDPLLAQHVAHLFARDTLTLFEEKLNLDDTKDTDHFEVRSHQ
jgi:hypothetical protein